MKRSLLILALLLFFASCATIYQPTGFTGGYSETLLKENLYRVTFRGNGFTSLERAFDFTLLRCAELALLNDYDHFVIVDASNYISNSTYVTPTTTKTYGNIQIYGNYAYGSATSTTYGGQVYNIRKPRVTLVVLCFQGEPNVNATVFDAEFLNKSIRFKYDIK